MRRLGTIAAAVALALAAGIPAASAHDGQMATNPCGVQNPHTRGDGQSQRVDNPATGGHYWIAQDYAGVQGGTGYIGVDGRNRRIELSNAAGDSQTVLSEGGNCVVVAGTRVI